MSDSELRLREVVSNWQKARKQYLSNEWDRKDPREFARRQCAMQTAQLKLTTFKIGEDKT